ncbi:MAG: thioredoxin [Eubacterium sp.]|nr:thioredoxin [Eubacterium sp.]
MGAIQIKEDEFEEVVLKSDKPVVVDFWAEWCGPCKMLGPILDTLADEHPEIKFVGVEADEAEDLVMKFGISNIPCLILFKGGEEVDRSIGFIMKSKLEEFISQ